MSKKLNCSNNIIHFEFLIRKMSNTFINRSTSSDNAIIKVFLRNMVAKEKMWE